MVICAVVVVSVFREGIPNKTGQNEHLWHQNDSQSLFWFIVTAQRERSASSLPETMDKSFHINLHIYRLPKKNPLKVNNNQMNIPVHSLVLAGFVLK